MAGCSKVPVVGGLGPSTVGGDAVDAIVEGVVDSLTEKVFSGSCGIVTEDGKSANGEATIANTIPVTGNVGRPPSEGRIGTIKDGHARSQSVEDHVVPHLLLLIVAQNVIKPIVSDAISGGELSGIQKVVGVPFVSRRTKAIRDGVLHSGLVAGHFENQVTIPVSRPRLDQPT